MRWAENELDLPTVPARLVNGRRTTRTDHAVAAVVPLLLLPQALRKEGAERLQVKLLQQGELCWRQVLKRVRVLQPCQNLVDNGVRCGNPVERLFESQVVGII